MSAVDADLDGFPPTAVSWGGDEMFRDPIRRFVERLEKAGVPTHAHEVHGMFHVFQILMPWAEASREIYDHVARFTEQVMDGTPPLPGRGRPAAGRTAAHLTDAPPDAPPDLPPARIPATGDGPSGSRRRAAPRSTSASRADRNSDSTSLSVEGEGTPVGVRRLGAAPEAAEEVGPGRVEVAVGGELGLVGERRRARPAPPPGRRRTRRRRPG